MLAQVGNMAVDGVKTVGGAVADGAKVSNCDLKGRLFLIILSSLALVQLALA